MKRYILLLLLLSLVLCASAGNKKERRIYYLDCSYSMITDSLWGPVCNDLNSAINSVQDPMTELVVIPFAVDRKWHEKLNIYYAKADSTGKSYLNGIIAGLKPSKNSMTYHSETLNDLYYNGRVDDAKITYVFIMTDGQDEESQSRFPSLLRQWGGEYGNQDVYGFYVMLQASAKNAGISKIIGNTKHFWEVSSANVNINIMRPDPNVNFFVREGNGRLAIPVSGDMTKAPISISGASPHYSVKGYTFSGDTLWVDFNIPSDLSMAPELEACSICLSLPDGKDEYVAGGTYSILVVDQINVQCINKKVKSINPTFR